MNERLPRHSAARARRINADTELTIDLKTGTASE
jgi:hypothetical protein